tara:strand:- start:338 stop:745 length:408 start_codon:yes stop_codon:yes gene_type:complete
MEESKAGFKGLSFDNPMDMFGEAVRRFAGQPFPDEMDALKNALFEGAIRREDDSGSVSFDPMGGLQVKPKNSNFNLTLNPIEKSVMVGYDSRQTDPVQEQTGFMPVEPSTPSAGQVFADEMNRRYRQKNPDWYRY